MKAEVTIRRSDLVSLSLYMLPRAGANRILLLIFVLIGFVAGLAGLEELDGRGVAAAAVVGIVFGPLGVIVGFLFCLPFILPSANEKSGTLGKHIYTIDASGLAEETPVNKALHAWAGIHDIVRSSRFIAIRINNYLFHVLPRRDFASDAEFDRFWQLCVEYHDAA